MNDVPFTPKEVGLLKTLNSRVRYQLPVINMIEGCIITGPTVAALSVGNTLRASDKVFYIFAPYITALDTIEDSVGMTMFRPSNLENTCKYLNSPEVLKWFTKEYIDLIADDIRMYDISLGRKIVVSVCSLEDYLANFKYHPIYCLGGKCFVNRYRLDEALKYAGEASK